MLLILTVILGLIYLPISYISLIFWILWNYVLMSHFALWVIPYWHFFYGCLSLFVAGVLVRGAVGKDDMTIQGILKD